jgi:chorismate lyase/3-hydroxybenzoate synthase
LLRPALRVSHTPSASDLLDFDFVDAALPLRSGCTWLGGARRESWSLADAVVDTSTPEMMRRVSGGFAALGLAMPVPEANAVAATTEQAYRTLLATARPSAHPYLIRIWNFVGAINAGDGDAECYRQFCVGRAQAVDAMFLAPPPAATAIGASHATAPLSVVALCSSAPAIALENPRQTPAWQYPREHGPVSPGFSRGAVLRDADSALLLASGTASIVGHVSQHVGDVLAQLDESLRNLDVLLGEGTQKAQAEFSRASCHALRVYLRDASALDVVAQRLHQSGIDPSCVAFLHGDVCRRELEIEIEGVFATHD